MSLFSGMGDQKGEWIGRVELNYKNHIQLFGLFLNCDDSNSKFCLLYLFCLVSLGTHMNKCPQHLDKLAFITIDLFDNSYKLSILKEK